MQNAKNHRRFFPLYHFVLIPISGFAFVWSIINLIQNPENWQQNSVLVLICLSLIIGALAARIASLKNQDRIIRLEMRYRYFELSGNSFSEKEKQLKLSQIIALRFAGDGELLDLVEDAIANHLSASEIKSKIKDWKADHRRV